MPTTPIRTFQVAIVDVFAERALAGNQLAVVLDAATLGDDEMQAIARETNFSETTFVTASVSDGDGAIARAKVRIFTPASELPFAGHPTLGTAFVLCGGDGALTLELEAGAVGVTFAAGMGWMTPPPVTFHGAFATDAAAALVGLRADDFDPTLPIALAEVGPKFALLPVKDLPALRKATLDVAQHRRLLARNPGVECAFLFTADAYRAQSDYAARMFFDAAGAREDPATGSACAALAAYLRKHRGDLGQVVVDQGVEIQRPSRIYIRVGDPLQVGGKVQPVMRGALQL